MCAGIQITSENTWGGKKPLLTPVSFHKGAEITQLPALSGRQYLVTASYFPLTVATPQNNSSPGSQQKIYLGLVWPHFTHS